MRAVALLSVVASLGVHGDEDASLLQAHASKKKLQPSNKAYWIEQITHAPNSALLQYSKLPAHEKTNLLQELSSSDVTGALALALRGSVNNKMSSAELMSALQNSAELDAVLAKKGKKSNATTVDDSSSDVDASTGGKNKNTTVLLQTHVNDLNAVVQSKKKGNATVVEEEEAEVEATTSRKNKNTDTEAEVIEVEAETNLLQARVASDLNTVLRKKGGNATVVEEEEAEVEASTSRKNKNTNTNTEAEAEAEAETNLLQAQVASDLNTVLRKKGGNATTVEEEEAEVEAEVEASTSRKNKNTNTEAEAEAETNLLQVGGRFQAAVASDLNTVLRRKGGNATAEENEVEASSEVDATVNRKNKNTNTEAEAETETGLLQVNALNNVLLSKKKGNATGNATEEDSEVDGTVKGKKKNADTGLLQENALHNVMRKKGGNATVEEEEEAVETSTSGKKKNTNTETEAEAETETGLLQVNALNNVLLSKKKGNATGNATEEDSEVDGTVKGKKKTTNLLQAASKNSQFIEQLARTPKQALLQYAALPTRERTLLLQQLASSEVAREVVRHREVLALGLRSTLLSKMSAAELVSKLQSSELDAVLSNKGDDSADAAVSGKGSNVDGAVTRKLGKKVKVDSGYRFERIGGRCKTANEFDDLNFTAACALREDTVTNGTCGSLTFEQTCEQLCDVGCGDFEVEDDVCKRFTPTLATMANVSLVDDCASQCVATAGCVAFEWDNSECELHDMSVDLAASEAEKRGRKNACYYMNIPETLQHNDFELKRIGGRCKTSADFADMNFTETCTLVEGTVDGDNCQVESVGSLLFQGICERACDADASCDEFYVEDSACKRFPVTQTVGGATTLEGCGAACLNDETCSFIEWDHGECELHGEVAAEATNAELHSASLGCYNVTGTPPPATEETAEETPEEPAEEVAEEVN